MTRPSLVLSCLIFWVLWASSSTFADSWPLTNPNLTSAFGPRVGDDYHFGVDLSASVGTDVFAVRSGTVSRSECIRGFGQTLIVEHEGDKYTLYAHLSERLKSVGDFVTEGDLIARSGDTDRADCTHLQVDPHLHVEYWAGWALDDFRNKLHPMRLLPYQDAGGPSINVTEHQDKIEIIVTTSDDELDVVGLIADIDFDVSPPTVPHAAEDLVLLDVADTSPADIGSAGVSTPWNTGVAFEDPRVPTENTVADDDGNGVSVSWAAVNFDGDNDQQVTWTFSWPADYVFTPSSDRAFIGVFDCAENVTTYGVDQVAVRSVVSFEHDLWRGKPRLSWLVDNTLAPSVGFELERRSAVQSTSLVHFRHHVGQTAYSFVDEQAPIGVDLAYLLYVDFGRGRRLAGQRSGVVTPMFEGVVVAPNPSRSTASFTYGSVTNQPGRVRIFSPTGRLVADLLDGATTTRRRTLTWRINGLPSGVYFYEVDLGARSHYGRFTVLR